jgi:hypothetical protein
MGYSNSTYSQDCNGSDPSNCLIDQSVLNKSYQLAQTATDQIKNVIILTEQQIENIRLNQSLKLLGKNLIATISIVVITWSIIKGIILSSTLIVILSDLLFPIIFVGLGLGFLDNNLGEIIVDSIQSVGNIFTNSELTSSSSSKSFVENMLKTMILIWDAPNNLNLYDLGIDVAAIFFMKLISIFCIAGSIASGLSVILIAKFQISLAIALGPILIPWGIWKPTEFLFNGWLNFLIKSSFTSLTVSIIEYSLRGSIIKLSELAGSVPPGVSSAYVYGVLTLISILFVLLIMKSAEIGSAIVSGSTINISIAKHAIASNFKSSPNKFG